jgi:uracil-DNA glycosylase
MFAEQLHPLWRELLDEHLSLLQQIEDKVLGDSSSIPEAQNIMRVFERSPLDYRVLIVGQDPYPNPEHAIGLSFAVPQNTAPLPPTLGNILRELASDLGSDFVSDGNIEPWSMRGVMLLNRHLTTSANQTGAHFGLGWDQFTLAGVQKLQEVRKGRLVAILWGNKAIELQSELQESIVLTSAHPSPLSSYRGFFGSKPFSRCNNALLELGLEPIDWSA